MSYSDGEARILLLLQGMAEFDLHNTARGDWKPLNRGTSSRYAIVRPGPFTNAAESIGAGSAITTWRTTVEIWQRWVDDSPTIVALEELVNLVIGHLERYPTLDGAALVAQVTGGSEMQQRWIKEGGPQWAVQEVYIDWQEERFIDSAE